MILIINHTDAKQTIAFEPVPRDRLWVLIAGYLLANETDELTVSYPGRSQSQVRGIAGSDDFYNTLSDFFSPILHPLSPEKD